MEAQPPKPCLCPNLLAFLRGSRETGRRENTDGNRCGVPSQCPCHPQSPTQFQPGRSLFLKLEISCEERQAQTGSAEPPSISAKPIGGG